MSSRLWCCDGRALGIPGVRCRCGGGRRPAPQALRCAFDLLLEEASALPEQGLAMSRMLHDTPPLQAGQLGKQLGWRDLLAPEVARRLGVPLGAADPRPRALAAAALGCLNAAVDGWTAADGALSLPGLLDQAMSALTG